MSVWQLSKAHRDIIELDEMAKDEWWNRNEARIEIGAYIADVCSYKLSHKIWQ